MIRALLLALVACRSDHPPTPAPVSTTGSGSSAGSAAFWAKYLGADGAQGPETRAYCTRKPKPTEASTLEVARGVTLRRNTIHGTCTLVVDGAATREARDVIEQWDGEETGTLFVERDLLTTSYVVERDEEDRVDNVTITWTRLDSILGVDGKLLAGFDPARAIGKSPVALRDAVSDPLVIQTGCDASACSAVGPRLAGGDGVRVDFLSAGFVVSLTMVKELRPHASDRITKVLGMGRRGASANQTVHELDGVRYLVRTNPTRIDIELTAVSSATR